MTRRAQELIDLIAGYLKTHKIEPIDHCDIEELVNGLLYHAKPDPEEPRIYRVSIRRDVGGLARWRQSYSLSVRARSADEAKAAVNAALADGRLAHLDRVAWSDMGHTSATLTDRGSIYIPDKVPIFRQDETTARYDLDALAEPAEPILETASA